MTTYLPFEILTAIFEEVNNVRDLWRIRTASRTLCAAATPIAFRALSVVTTRGSAQNLGRLFDDPDIAAHVREVAYHDTGVDRRGRTLKYVRTSAVHELASSLSRVHQLPRLETIKLKFYPSFGNQLDGDRLALQASILGALSASFSVCAPPNLRSLSLHNLRTWDLSPLESPPFQTVLTNLWHLQLSVLPDSDPDPETTFARWCHFWGTLTPRMILAPTQHALTELTLHSDIHVGASSGLSLAGLHFPHLCALSLCKLVFEPSVAVEPFILRHAATLARLELLACKLPTALAGEEWSISGSGGWDRIWDRFAVELIALVVLHVDERSRRRWGFGLVYRYVRPDPERMAYWEIDLDSRNVADAAALRRFHVTVVARSEHARGAS
ncbi:hypothetical protein BJY52DRAFT_1418162 [Lactarius psammicola]|nr:hypothetical protein BJY52DRAFT_1418162 [Lactarius psammicola]